MIWRGRLRRLTRLAPAPLDAYDRPGSQAPVLTRPTRREEGFDGHQAGAFIMTEEGVARLFTTYMVDGPFSEHYEPAESPSPNLLHNDVAVNPPPWNWICGLAIGG